MGRHRARSARWRLVSALTIFVRGGVLAILACGPARPGASSAPPVSPASVATAPTSVAPPPPASPAAASAPASADLWALPRGQTPAQAIGVGNFWACALLADRTVWCWGDTHTGMVSTPTLFPRQMPIAHVTALEVGPDAAYALDEAGALYTWGEQYFGPVFRQLAEPVVVEPRGVAEVSVSAGYACMRGANGPIDCWGDSGVRVRIAVDGAASIAAGPTGACAMKADGGVWCWPASAPAHVKHEIDGAEQIAMGDAVGCAVVHGGTVRCWGNTPAARRAEGLLAGAHRLRAGPNSLCALSDADLPRCVFTSVDQRVGGVPIPVVTELPNAEAFRGAIDVRAGPQRACGLVRGAVACWGSDLHMDSANDDPMVDLPTNMAVPVHLGDLTALTRVASVAVAYGHRCIVTKEAELYCWGDGNEHGQLGQGDFKPRAGPTLVQGVGLVRSVSVGDAQTCAVTQTGDVVCFGAIPFARGPCSEQYPPLKERCEAKPLRVASGATGVAVGTDYACLLATDGHVRCWGNDDDGQLGDGARGASAAPVTVLDEHRQPLEGVTSLQAFGAFTCAIDRAQRFWCWGRNEPGTQGRPYNSPARIRLASQPFSLGPVAQVAIPTSELARKLSGGSYCVRMQRGELRCWGGLAWTGPPFYEPARVGICDAQLAAGGPGLCTRDTRGHVTCLWPHGRKLAGLELHADDVVSMSGSIESMCTVDGSGRLSCVRADVRSEFYASSTYPEVGLAMATAVERSVAPTCPLDGPRLALPRFPPEPYTRVTVRQVDPTGQARSLSKGQAGRLVSLLNDPTNFTSISVGCDGPEHHQYVFEGDDGEAVGTVQVCPPVVTLRSKRCGEARARPLDARGAQGFTTRHEEL